MLAFTPPCCAQASYVLVHAGYNSTTTMLNDLALLYFATPFTCTNAVRALPLPSQGTNFRGGLQCTVSGWGETSYGMRLTPDVKRDDRSL